MTTLQSRWVWALGFMAVRSSLGCIEAEPHQHNETLGRASVIKSTAAIKAGTILTAQAQTTPPKSVSGQGGEPSQRPLSFDAASIKPVIQPPISNVRTGGPGTKNPSRIHYPYITLRTLLIDAYDVQNYQIVGAGWLDTERYELNATMPPDTSKDLMRTMLQNLLFERFKLAVHRETKDLPMYTLVVSKNGPTLKESVTSTTEPDGVDAVSPQQHPRIGADGFPALPELQGRAGVFILNTSSRIRAIFQDQSIQELAKFLASRLRRPVDDATGLTPRYDFILTFNREGLVGPTPPSPSAEGSLAETSLDTPDIFDAVKSLGLKLEPRRGPVELIIIDHAEKRPTEN